MSTSAGGCGPGPRSRAMGGCALKFTHDSVASKFRDGRGIETLMQDLRGRQRRLVKPRGVAEELMELRDLSAKDIWLKAGPIFHRR